MTDVRELIRQEAAEAQARRNEPLPADAVGTRPNSTGTNPRVLSVRLSGEQLDALTTAAESAGVPVSTFARMLVVRGLTDLANPPVGSRIESVNSGPEVAEHLYVMIRDAIGTEVQHVVRSEVRTGVHDELSRTVRPEFLREPA